MKGDFVSKVPKNATDQEGLRVSQRRDSSCASALWVWWCGVWWWLKEVRVVASSRHWRRQTGAGRSLSIEVYGGGLADDVAVRGRDVAMLTFGVMNIGR